MQIKLNDLRRIIREELSRLNERTSDFQVEDGTDRIVWDFTENGRTPGGIGGDQKTLTVYTDRTKGAGAGSPYVMLTWLAGQDDMMNDYFVEELGMRVVPRQLVVPSGSDLLAAKDGDRLTKNAILHFKDKEGKRGAVDLNVNVRVEEVYEGES